MEDGGSYRPVLEESLDQGKQQEMADKWEGNDKNQDSSIPNNQIGMTDSTDINTNNHSPQQTKPAQKALPPSHTPLQITAGNAYDSRRQNLRDQQNDKRQRLGQGGNTRAFQAAVEDGGSYRPVLEESLDQGKQQEMADKWEGNDKNQDSMLEGEHERYDDYYGEYG